MIEVKRAYEPLGSQRGKWYLVERLGPRGIRKDKLRIDAWIKNVAPSAELRQWFSHAPAKRTEFRRYFRELDTNPAVWQPLLDAASGGQRVTLIYSSRDTEHNNALAPRDYLKKKLQKQSGRAPKAA